MKSLKVEFLAGLTTFLTMSYIIIVNPLILSTPGTGMSYSGVLTATVLLAFSMTLLMGLYAKLPFAVAPGMGLNAFFTYHVVLGQQVPWQTALGAVFWSGILFLLISATPLREHIANALPKGIRVASACGIGLLLAFIGLKSAGLIVADPATFVKLGKLGMPQIFSMFGLVIIAVLVKCQSPLAFLAGILFVTLFGFFSGSVHMPESFFAMPDFTSVFGQMDIMGALKLSLLPTVIIIMFTDLFDSVSTLVGVAEATNLKDESGKPKNLRQGLIVDSIATFLAGIFGTSPGTAYIESAAGIKMGGRTGMTSVATALCFLPCLFIAPLIGIIPAFATAPVLITVGAMMFASIKEVISDSFEEMLPAFLTLVMIPLTFSITQGLLWGVIAHVLCFACSGRLKEVRPSLWMLSALCLGLLIIENA